jgi:ubiquitin carboxyl-terminal hydrolase 25/28
LQTDGNKELEEIGKKAVSIIARERKSNYLNNWLSGDENNQTSMNVDEALRLLGVEAALETVDGSLWPQIFAGARESKPSELTEQAISAVHKALAGPSASVSTGHSPETWPVGLVSHGNTCYLNSLLQYYFSLKPLRDIVTNYDQYKMDTAESQEKLERVGQRRVSTQEIQGGQKFADELRHLFERMIKDRGPAVKPEQDLVCRAFLDPKDFAQLEEQRKHGAGESAIDDCAVQPGVSTNGAEEETKEPDAGQSRASSETLAEDVKMNGSEMPPTPPASPGQKPADPPTNEPAPPPLPARRFSTTTSDTLRQAQAKATQQQDVTEVHDSITQRLRAGMQPTGADNRGEQKDALRDLFAIGMSQVTLSGGSSSKPEIISDSSIQLNVPTEPTTLYSALDDYFDPQMVTEGSEKQQYRSIVELPPLIQINMPRIGFSKEKGAFKSDMPLRLEDELYLDRYCEGVQGVLERRRAAWGWRKQLSDVKKEQKALKSTKIELDGPTAVLETAKYLQDLEEVNKELWALEEEEIEGDSTLSAALKADSALQADRVTALDGEVQKLQDRLTGTFDEFKEKKYRLYAVFFHRGGPSSGHYWSSIHDFKNDIWRNYNDESVTEVPKSQLQEIFYADKWQHGTPTFAVYVRDDLKGNYVEAVRREPEAAPEAPMPDLEMLDAPLNGNTSTVNPIELIKEGGDNAWDEERQVADAKWG